MTFDKAPFLRFIFCCLLRRPRNSCHGSRILNIPRFIIGFCSCYFTSGLICPLFYLKQPCLFVALLSSSLMVRRVHRYSSVSKMKGTWVCRVLYTSTSMHMKAVTRSSQAWIEPHIVCTGNSGRPSVSLFVCLMDRSKRRGKNDDDEI